MADKPEVQVKWYRRQRPAGRAGRVGGPGAGRRRAGGLRRAAETAKAPPAIPTWEQIAARVDTEVEKLQAAWTRQDAAEGIQQQAASIGTGPDHDRDPDAADVRPGAAGQAAR